MQLAERFGVSPLPERPTAAQVIAAATALRERKPAETDKLMGKPHPKRMSKETLKLLGEKSRKLEAERQAAQANAPVPGAAVGG